MELHGIRGGNKSALEAREYNIGVGVSLGNKWFTIENTVELTKWALRYSRETVIVYVADSIHAINLEVRNHTSYEKALSIAKSKGSKFLMEVENEIRGSFSVEERNKIVYATWDEIVNFEYKEKDRASN